MGDAGREPLAQKLAADCDVALLGDVGDDACNQTLPEARAKSVVAWLTAHGAGAGRLGAKGYGRTHPVASNDEDAGRAKNRRVELAKPDCAAK